MMPPSTDWLGRGKEALGVIAAMVLLFSAFFWAGFYLGRTSAPKTAAAPMVTQPAAPASERLQWRIAGN